MRSHWPAVWFHSQYAFLRCLMLQSRTSAMPNWIHCVTFGRHISLARRLRGARPREGREFPYHDVRVQCAFKRRLYNIDARVHQVLCVKSQRIVIVVCFNLCCHASVSPVGPFPCRCSAGRVGLDGVPGPNELEYQENELWSRDLTNPSPRLPDEAFFVIFLRHLYSPCSMRCFLTELRY